MAESREELRQELQEKLRELFQFNVSDLDFGIYRILNRKKDEIKKFIQKDLLNTIEDGLEEYKKADKSKVEDAKQKVVNSLGEGAFEDGELAEQYKDTPVGDEYLAAKKEAKKQEVGEEIEKRIYQDLYIFFSRYYDNGDFLTQRRISTRDNKYAIPYNGEEVKLHWANKEQYYIKTGEHFTDYKFEADGLTINFKLQGAETEKDNIQDNETRYFILRPEDPIEINEEEDVLTLWFEYRILDDEDEKQYWLDIYNEAEEKSLKTIDRQRLCIAFDEWVRSKLSGKWRNALSKIPENKERSLLYTKLNHYTAKNTSDYFIHKNLQDFLERELEYYLKHEVIQVDDFIKADTDQPLQRSLTRAKVVRNIGSKIISFLSQIENFQKRLFEKKKFVIDTDYCFTLDIIPQEHYDKIIDNEEQLNYWEEIYSINKWDDDLGWKGEWDISFLETHPYLMIDTAFFEDSFKYDLLASIDELDEKLDGLLINGENFQSLNLIKRKFQNQVETIYIDPPYNTERDRETGKFIYKDGYATSSWASLMNDRVDLSKKLLSDEGIFIGSIDDNEIVTFRSILNQIYGNENFISTITWKSRSSVSSDHKISQNHNYHLLYSKNDDKNNFGGFAIDKDEYENPDDDPRGPWKLVPIDANKPGGDTYYPVTNPNTGEEYYPPNGRSWSVNSDKFQELLDDGRILFGKTGEAGPQRKLFYNERIERGDVKTPISFWDGPETTKDGTSEIMSLFGEKVFDYPKPVETIKELIFISNKGKKLTVLDYFAGSGTTGHSALRINKQFPKDVSYILVEMGKYFSSVLKPRIQKVVFSDNWNEGVPEDKKGQSHAFKYHYLESYEDTLNNINFKNKEDSQKALEFEDYMLDYMLDFETEGVSPSLLNNEAFETPFDYKLDIQREHATSEKESVDLVETFHYLIGLWVQKLRKYKHQERQYIVSQGEVREEDGIENILVIWRNTSELDLEKEAEWLEETVLAEQAFDRIYINGNNKIKGADPIELTFREKMFEAKV